MKQRYILTDIAPDFRRENQTQPEYIEHKKNETIDFIRDYVEQSGMQGIVLGISGGVDSYLAGMLCALALRKQQKQLRLLILPNGEQTDYADAIACVEHIRSIYPGATCDTVSIGGAYHAAVEELGQADGFTGDAYTLGNLQPRIRMMYQYALAKNMLVAGTDHATESITGFYTKYGDGGTDINPLQQLVKDDIFDMARTLGAPSILLEKKPSAGLGITPDDESELGISYADICAYLKGNRIQASVQEKLEAMYDRSRHKRALPASLKDFYQYRPRITILVIDFIHTFVDSELARLNAVDAVDNSIHIINQYPNANVLYISDRHPPDHCSFLEQGGNWEPHAVRGTRGTEYPSVFYQSIKKTTNTPIERYNVFLKGQGREEEQYSGIDSTNEFFGSLRGNVSKDVLVMGTATEYCILHTVRDLLAMGCNVRVPRKCLGYTNLRGHKSALEQMKKEGAIIL